MIGPSPRRSPCGRSSSVVGAGLLVASFAATGSSCHGLAAWLPDAHVERGRSASGAAIPITPISLPAIPASLAVNRRLGDAAR